MKSFKHDLSLRIAKLMPIILATVPFGFCWYGYFADSIMSPYFNRGNWMIIALFVALYVTFARVYDAFLVSINRISEIAYSQCLAVLLSDAMMFVVIWLLNHSFPNIIPCLITLAVQLVLVVLWSVIVHKWYFACFPPIKTAIVYSEHYNVASLMHQYGLEKKFDVQAVLDAQDCVANIEQLEGFQAIFVCGVNSHNRNQLLKYCAEKGISVYVLPRIGDIIMNGAKRMHMFHLPMLRVDRWNPKLEYKLAKRLFDIVASLIALVPLSGVMLATAIAIKLTDGGPVFYKQDRLTKDGKVFKVLKFRSMRVDAEKDGVARLSTGDNDDRITPVGRIIRKCRIDELPQLLNILGGSMSVVGPRPERPEIAKQYEEELPEFRLRLQVKAGLTGYAQVYGKYNTTPYDKLQMDLMYIAKPSFMEDLRIIFATMKILFVPESTDGIAVGQTTAMGGALEFEEKEEALTGK